MKSKINYLLLLALLTIASCEQNYGDLNSPTVDSYIENATLSQLNSLVTGTESGLRNSTDRYLDVVGVIGREIYRFGDPRYDLELLGDKTNTLLNSNFYITDNWAARYRVVKNTNVLIESAQRSGSVSEEQRKAYLGFAKTIKAYQLLLNLNLTYTNGIRVDVLDPDKLGPIVDYNAGLAEISKLLDEARTDLSGSSVVFPLSTGFTGFSNAAGLIKFNRALAARVAVYQKNWSDAINALNESFLDLNGNFSTGVYHVFCTGAGDQLNSAYAAQNKASETRTAHPSYAADIEANDDRIAKAPIRTSAISINGLTGNRDVWVYTSSTAPLPIIRNEELILLYAEAKIQSSDFSEAVKALDKIRSSHNLQPYAGALTKDALTNELLKQRRYSLFFEGHRWIDVRRYDKLNTLPKDRPADDIWEKLPLPASEAGV
ncbi:RagB/SusD family nutrient uptake outer membrane protein [Desertivirga brevis]|uniref:RagB/SusD family nutrient uptake outer membrane protein n=1 Tax=Desertivirga brevis TaxID=2810310 RepID=UPI001A962587|nr:RagB/SusD family nutrient uptake outer membrane protein [Pedobacter sp. SYSU D00873]